MHHQILKRRCVSLVFYFSLRLRRSAHRCCTLGSLVRSLYLFTFFLNFQSLSFLVSSKQTESVARREIAAPHRQEELFTTTAQ